MTAGTGTTPGPAAGGAAPLRVLSGVPLAEAPGLAVVRVDGLDALAERAAAEPVDAVVAELPPAEAVALPACAAWRALLRETALLLVVPGADDALAAALAAAGVQEVLDTAGAVDARRLRIAVARKAREREARKAWSTDLDTGLPNRAQLLEHLHQLLALRARQPAPMAVLVLRLDGLDAVAAAHGPEAAQLLRRKVAVRLRGAVRASDVVAALGGDEFALLLAKLESAADARHVAAKLERALRAPVTVLGLSLAVRAHVGVACHPDDAPDAEPLLRRAAAEAALAARRGRDAANG